MSCIDPGPFTRRGHFLRHRDRPFRFIVTEFGLFPGMAGHDAGVIGHVPGISPNSLE